MFYIIIALIAGITIVLARIINANLANEIGTFQSTFFNYVTGLLLSLFFMILFKDFTNLFTISGTPIPPYAYLGGLVGVIVVVLSNYTTHKISALYLTLFVFIGQLITGMLIDYLIQHTLSIGKIAGGLFVFAGLSYNLLIDYKTTKNIPPN